ncbi:unnamed protein product, partial [Brassica rapa subsp. trilocularis]
RRLLLFSCLFVFPLLHRCSLHSPSLVVALLLEARRVRLCYRGAPGSAWVDCAWRRFGCLICSVPVGSLRVSSLRAVDERRTWAHLAPSTPALVSGRRRLPQLLFRRLLFLGRQGLYSLTSPARGVEVPSWVRIWGLILDPVFYGFGLVPMIDRSGPWCLVSVIAVKAQIVKVSSCSRQLSVVRRKRSSEEVVSVEAWYFTSSGESREMLRRRCDAAAVRSRRRCHVQLQLVVLMRSRYLRWKISVEDRLRCCDRALVSGDTHFRFRRRRLHGGGRANDRQCLGFPRVDGLGVGSNPSCFVCFVVLGLGLGPLCW